MSVSKCLCDMVRFNQYDVIITGGADWLTQIKLHRRITVFILKNSEIFGPKPGNAESIFALRIIIRIDVK